MEKTLLDEIMTLKDVLPKKQRILCQYLALNYERKVSLLSVSLVLTKLCFCPR